MNLLLNDFQQLFNAKIYNERFFKKVTGISTDSRTVKKENVFFALRGENFDGHNFLEEVVKKKVTAIVVDNTWFKKNHQQKFLSKISFIVVSDTIKSYGDLAHIYRNKFSLPIIAIGGSNGKTTTKEMVTTVLKKKFTVLSTEKNFNNQIGVPQVLFRLNSDYDIAVLELGTNQFGEMQRLCEISEPTHALVTNIGKEHLEFFKNEQGVAKEETALFRWIEKNNGFGFVNVDDKFLKKYGKILKNKTTYGFSSANFQVKNVQLNELGQSSFEVHNKREKKKLAVQLSVSGKHNVTNAVSAIAVGKHFSVPQKKIIDALQKFTPASKRMEIIVRSGITILNDTYNSNPTSVEIALQTLQSMKTNGRKIIVLGDMFELGTTSKKEHENIGKVIKKMKFQYLFTTGKFSAHTFQAAKIFFGKHYTAKNELIKYLQSFVQPGDKVLVKGSRGMKMEEVVSIWN